MCGDRPYLGQSETGWRSQPLFRIFECQLFAAHPCRRGVRRRAPDVPHRGPPGGQGPWASPACGGGCSPPTRAAGGPRPGGGRPAVWGPLAQAGRVARMAPDAGHRARGEGRRPYLGARHRHDHLDRAGRLRTGGADRDRRAGVRGKAGRPGPASAVRDAKALPRVLPGHGLRLGGVVIDVAPAVYPLLPGVAAYEIADLAGRCFGPARPPRARPSSPGPGCAPPTSPSPAWTRWCGT